MQKQLIYLALTEGSNRVTIDGDFTLFSQLISTLSRHELEMRAPERRGLLPDDRQPETAVKGVQNGQ
jgi:hypothetical protein